MKFLFALTFALFLTLVSPVSCQDGPDIFPDEYTRKIARELDLKTIKEIHIYVTSDKHWDLTVTDPKVIALLIDGFKTANTTNFSNKTDYVEVMDKNGDALISYSFSVRHFPELSPELVEGLKAAGAEPKGWQEWKESEQRAEALGKKVRELLIWALPLAILSGLALFVFKRRTQARN